MKLACMMVVGSLLCGCTTTRETPSAKPKPIEQDVQLVSDFLDALLRPNASGFQVIADADSEESMGHIPLAIRNTELRERLELLSKPPSSVIKVNLRSAAFPKPWGSGHYIYTFDTQTGNFDEVRPHEIGGDKADMWIRIDHWPNGTRLVSLSFTWIDDLKDNIFHLRKGEQKFRFAIAIEPLTN